MIKKYSIDTSKFVDYFRNNDANLLDELSKIDVYAPGKHDISYLYKCYAYLCNNNMVNVIYDILKLPANDDENFICMVAIDNNMIDVIELLIQKNEFNLNEIYITCEYGLLNRASVLDYCVRQNNITMFKFFINRGINIKKMDNTTIKSIYGDDDNEAFFDYYLDEISVTEDSCYILSKCCEYNSYEKVKKVLKLGPNIAENSQYLFLRITNCDLEILKLLIDNGLVVDDDLFDIYCLHNKLDAIDFLLNYGIKPSQKTLALVFKQMRTPIIKLFLKYDVDLSLLPNNYNEEHIQYINQLDMHGLDQNKLLHYLLRKNDDDDLYQNKFKRMRTPDFSLLHSTEQ